MQASGKRHSLSGIDYFQLLIDHHNKKDGGLGHATKLAIELKGHLPEAGFRKALETNPVCRQLAQIRVDKTGGLGYPSIVFEPGHRDFPVTFHQIDGNEVPESFYQIPVRVYEQAPLHIQVFYFNSGNTCVLFSFHHILFDFTGVQSLIATLCGAPDIPLLPAPAPKRPFFERLRAFFQAVGFTFKEANWKMTAPERPLPPTLPRYTVFRELRLTETETRTVLENAQQIGPAFHRSAFLLAGAAKALHDEIFSRQRRHRFVWVPVPVNVRKKGAKGAVLQNGLSFLFYKLKPEELTGLPETIRSIQDQMKVQMRRDLPRAFLEFADAYWYMPLPVYYPMFNLPSLGKLSSFSFSALGDSFPGLTEFMGLPVLDVRNYPSNSISPGITLSYYEFRGQLRLMSSWVQGQYHPEEQERVLQRVKSLLLQGG